MVSIGFAAMSEYGFSQQASGYTELANPIQLHGTAQDDAWSAVNNIGFNFQLDGVAYPSFKANSNGYITLNPSSTSSWTNALATNILTIAPLWDDMKTADTDAGVFYELTGTAPNRILKVQYKNVKWYYNASPVNLINYQIWLHETSNLVEFVYGTFGTSPGSPSASCGISGPVSGNYLSVTPGNPSTVSSTTEFNTINATHIPFMTGFKYTFTPPAASAVPGLTTPIYPANEATNIFATSVLSWADGGGWTQGYHLYFGTDANPPYVGDMGMVTSYDPPGDMAFNSTYYWKVIPYNNIGQNNEAVVWSFTTAGAPLSGTLTIAPEGGDYATFTEAINALHATGVGTGGVTFEVAEGTYAENPPEITLSGSAANPIIFQAAREAITNPILAPTGGTGTFGIKFNGAQYVTFDGIDIQSSNLIYGYWLYAGSSNITIQNCAINPGYVSTTNYGVYSFGSSTATNNNNTITGNTITNAYSSLYFSGSTAYNQNLVVSNNTVTGVRGYGIYHNYGQNSEISGNNLSYYSGATTTFYCLYSTGTNSSAAIFDNVIDGGSTSTTIYGLYFTGGTNDVHNNEIKNITITSTSTFYGAYLTSGSTNFYNNTISGLTGNGTIYGMYISGGTLHNVFNNMIYDLTYGGTSSHILYGTYFSSGTEINYFNNMIYDLKNVNGTGTTLVRGINIAGGTTVRLMYNTVYLNASGSNENYSTAALYMTPTSNTYQILNNIFVNESTPGTGANGRTVAFWKSSAGVTNITAQRNIYYAGAPSATNLIFYQQSTGYPTLDEYKQAVVSIDQDSFSEDVPFLSSVSPYNLHIDPVIQTRVEGNALPITEITWDIDNDLRNGTTPDIGADEGNFTVPAGVPGNVALIGPANGAENLDPNSIIATWSAPAIGGAPTLYYVFVGESLEEFWDTQIGYAEVPATNTTLDLATIDGLELGFQATYYWAVQAHNADGDSDIEDPGFMIYSFSTTTQMQAANTLGLGTIWPGNEVQGSIAIQNLGSTPLAFDVDAPEEFRFGAIGRYTIPAHTTADLPYTFTAPMVQGPYTGTVTISETSPGDFEIEVAVNANISSDVVVGTGTADLDLPNNCYYGYTYSQSIYYPTELNWPAGYRIEKIYYYFNGYETCPDNSDWYIWMGHTPNATFASTTDWVPLANLTQVYHQTNIPQEQTGGYWMEFMLDTPFIYNGVDNLVIAVDENAPSYDASSAYFLCTNTNGVNRSIRYYSDGTNPDPAAPPTGTLIAGHPNTKFLVAEIPTQPVLTVIPEAWDFGTQVINTTHTKEFTISNTGSGILSISNIGITGATSFTLSQVPELPVNLTTGQSANFTVQYQPDTVGELAATVTLTDNRLATEISLTGYCVDPRILSLPHSENFDEVTVPALPFGWSAIVQSTSTYPYVRTVSSTPHTSPNNVVYYNSSDLAGTYMLVSPQTTLPINTIKLSYWARWSSYATQLVIGTMSDPANAATFVPYHTQDLTSTNAQYNVSFASYEGTDQYFAFKMQATSTYSYIYLDTILFEALVANDLAATAISGPSMCIVGTQQSFDITVFNNGTAVQNSYTVKLMSQDARTELVSLQVNEALAPNAIVTHTLNWIPTLSGNYVIYGEAVLAGDQNATNNATDVITVGIYPEGTYMPYIGDPATTTSANNYPINMFYKNNVSETIYLAHELQMTSGTIQAVIYNNNFTQDLTKPIKIWMKNTTEISVASAFLPFDGYTLVFEGNVHFPLGANAVIIPLQVPFAYTGANLAVRLYRIWEDGYWSSSNVWYNTLSTDYPGRTRYHQIDGTGPLDPILLVDVSGSPFTGTLVSNVPNTQFVVTPANPVQSSAPAVSIAQVGTDVVLSWVAVPYMMSYNVYISDNPYVFGEVPDAVVINPTYTHALGTNVMKYYKVTSNSYRGGEVAPVFIVNPAQIRGIDNGRIKAEPLIISTRAKN